MRVYTTLAYRIITDVHRFNSNRTGDRRFRLPESIPGYTGSFSALEYGLACPQQECKIANIDLLPEEAQPFLIDAPAADDEDCEFSYLHGLVFFSGT